MTTRRSFLVQVMQYSATSVLVPRLLSAGDPVGSGTNAGVWQIGCYTRPWAAFDYRVAFDAIAAAGFKHVGLMTTNTKSHLVISADTSLEEAQTIGQEARNRGMQIPSVYGGGFPVQKSLEAGIEGLRRIIDNCVAAGAKSLLLGGIGSDKLYDAYFKVVAECCDYAAEKRLPLTIKPHGGLNATGAQLRKAIEMVGKKNFTVWYDAGNIYYYSDGKLSPVDDAPSVNGLVTGWCIKDFKLEPKKEVSVTPGTGMVDFKAVFQQLKKGGFAGGPLVVETLTPGEPLQLLEEARKARKFLEELVGGG